MTAFYNEIDPYAADWLRNLIDAGHIAPGVVDQRSIVDIHPDELRGFTQCHFFAGIGVWSHALRLAGWPDDRPVWTGSCPCQPFSAAGKGTGFSDERHLWPAWHHLIAECRPPSVFGEQVASADGLEWLDLVHADLEAACYAVGAADLCAAGVGAPHIRQRLFFVGHTDDRRGGRHAGAIPSAQGSVGREVRGFAHGAEPAGAARDLADAADVRRAQPGHARKLHGSHSAQSQPGEARSADRSRDLGAAGRLAYADGAQPGITGRPGSAGAAGLQCGPDVDGRGAPGAVSGFWSDAEWIPCRDGKARPIEPGTFPLAHGAPARVGRLRAYGNAIVSEAAAAFIRAAC